MICNFEIKMFVSALHESLLPTQQSHQVSSFWEESTLLWQEIFNWLRRSSTKGIVLITLPAALTEIEEDFWSFSTLVIFLRAVRIRCEKECVSVISCVNALDFVLMFLIFFGYALWFTYICEDLWMPCFRWKLII